MRNKHRTVFTMLVVPGLVWRIPFGENHLHAAQTLVDHYVPAVTFRHPGMQFRVQCSLDNPLKGFTSVSTPNASLSHESGQTTSEPHVSVTCLVTGAPPPGVHKRSQSLHRRVNFVTVSVTLSAALRGYQLVRQPLWIEGKQIHHVLSGPFVLSQISSHVTLHNTHSNSDPYHNVRLVYLPETPDCVLEEARDRVSCTSNLISGI